MNVFGRQWAVARIMLATASIGMSADVFDPLFQIGKVGGTCIMRRPGVQEYEVAVEGRAYPYGTEVRTQADSEVIVFLSRTVQLRFGGSTSATVAHSPSEGHDAKTVTMTSGTLGVFSPNDEAELPLKIVTPLAVIDNFKGRAELRLVQGGEENHMVVATAIGDARVRGPQFSIEKMRRSARLEIITALDESYTSLAGKSGEFEMLIERGSEDPSIVEFRTGSHVKIWRRWSSLSNRLAVSVMVAGAGGGVKESFAYLQGESEILEAVTPVETGLDLGETAVPASNNLFDNEPRANSQTGGAGTAAPASDSAPVKDSLWDF